MVDKIVTSDDALNAKSNYTNLGTRDSYFSLKPHENAALHEHFSEND